MALRLKTFGETQCGKQIFDAIGSKIGKDEFEKFVAKIENEKKAGNVMSPNDLAAFVAKLEQEYEGNLFRDKLKAIKNETVRTTEMERLLSSKQAGYDNMYDALQARLVGNGKGDYGGLSISGERNYMQMLARSDFHNQLKEAGVRNLFGKGNDVQIAEAILAVARKQDTSKMNKDFVRIAEIYNNLNSKALKNANDQLAFIKDLEDHLMSTTHNPLKMLYAEDGGFGLLSMFDSEGKKETSRAKSEKIWSEFIDSRLNWDEVIKRLDPIEGLSFDKKDFLKRTFNAIVTGIRKESSVVGVIADGQGKRIDYQLRKLVFKDAKSHVEYNEKFGTGNLLSSLSGTLEKLASDEVLLRHGGDNLINNFTRAADEAAKTMRDKGDQSLAGKQSDLQSMLDHAVGNTDVGNPQVAILMTGLRNYASSTMLGASGALSFILDRTNAIIIAKSFGMSLDEIALANSYFSTDSMRKVQSELGIMSELAIGSIHATNYNQDILRMNFGGWTSKLMSYTMWFNGNRFITDSLKTGFSGAWSNHLFKVADKTFEELNPFLKYVLKRYEIDSKAWDKLRAAKVNVEGKDFLSTSRIDDINVRSKVGYMFTDMANTFVTTPSERWAAWINKSPKGTLTGELMRGMMQLKSFTIAQAERSYGAIARNADSKLGAAGAGAAYFALMSGMGAFYYTLKSAWQGRDAIEQAQKDPKKFWMASISTGGGLSILGDVAGGATNPNVTIWDGLMPAMISKATQPFRAVTAKKDRAAKIAMNAKTFIPLNNHPLATAIIDRAFLKFAEDADPMAIRNLEEKAKKSYRPYFWGLDVTD